MPDADVVVVGAGIAGLVTARTVAAAGGSVVVLEARDRVGGRTDHHVLASGDTVEMGGQWVGPTQSEILSLIDELGLTTYEQFATGQTLRVIKGAGRTPQREPHRLLEQAGPAMRAVQDKLEAMAETVSLSAPWLTPNGALWDSMTLESWLAEHASDPIVLDYWRTIVAALFAAEPAEMSLLHFLFYLKSGGMLDMLAGIEGGAQERRIVGGSHLISERIAAQLGDVVRLSSPVHAIRQDDAGAAVSHDGGTVTAQRVVVAVPPTLAGRLRYQPLLPAVRDGLTQQVPMGSVIKIQVAYDRPFWRDSGLSGEVFSMDDPLSVVVDNTPHGSEIGVLVGFFEGARARVVSRMAQPQRQALAVECLTRFFGPAAAEVVEYAEKDWTAEEYTRGCYGGRLGAGVWTQFGPALAEPVGRIHWAGAETADVWNGYMDGAARSGRRAAAEVLAALGFTTSGR
jgi:monoamine oxidase